MDADLRPTAPARPPLPPARTSVLARLAVPAGIMTAVAGAFAYVGTVDPNEPGHYPACPLLRYTGIYCPGCGGLRSAHAFVHGDLAAALQANAPAVLGYLAFAVLWTVWVVRAAADARRPSRRPGPAVDAGGVAAGLHGRAEPAVRWLAASLITRRTPRAGRLPPEPCEAGPRGGEGLASTGCEAFAPLRIPSQ